MLSMAPWNHRKLAALEGVRVHRAGQESFWFSPGYLFSEAMIPAEGVRVVFLPMDPLSKANKRRASQVFILGSTMHGEVKQVMKGKGYGFARIEGWQAEHSLYIELPDDSGIGPGASIEFVIAENRGVQRGSRSGLCKPGC
jgi:hypothetical protein